jgi:hypothetical protein
MQGRKADRRVDPCLSPRVAFIANGLAMMVLGWGMRRIKHDVAA